MSGAAASATQLLISGGLHHAALSSAPPPAGGDGLVFGLLNGAWAVATVLMPLVAGALQHGAGSQAAYLAVIAPSCAAAAARQPR